MLKIAAFVALLAVAHAGVVKVQPCEESSRGPVPLEVRVEGCEGAKCVFKAEEEIEVEIDFKSNQDSKTIYYDATARIGGIDISLPDVQHDGCKGLKPACPIENGKQYTHHLSQKLSKNLPRVKDTRVTVFAKGDNGALGCGYILADLV